MLVLVLATMMASVLAVQLANFTLLQFVPLPRPPVFTIAEVAAAARTRANPEQALRFRWTAAPEATQPGRAGALAAAIARELGLPQQAVRLTFRDPPMPGGARLRGPPGPIGPRQPIGPPGALVGDFTASARQPDGRWLTIEPVRSGITAWRLRLLFWLLVALISIAPFAWLLARWIARPIRTFAEAAERIGRDPKSAPLAIAGPAEITHAAGALNDMQRRLNRYVDDRTIVIGAIAHDLRTPLMRLSLRLDHAPEPLRRAIEADVQDMDAMIAAATDYVREATQSRPRRRLDLRSLAESMADDYADRGGAVTALPGPAVIVTGDMVALKSVLDNLLTNALRYAGNAEIAVSATDQEAMLEVRDRGPGVSPDELDRIFEPFFRTEGSRSRDTGGIGLGLASVRGVARMHGGDAIAKNRTDGGLAVQVTLGV